MTNESEALLKLFGRLMQQRMFAGAAMGATRYGGGHNYNNSRGQLRLLQLLAEEDDISNATIAEKLDIRPSSVSTLVKKLEDAGFIERRESASDKRVQLIHLTQAGRDYIKDSRNLHDDLSAALFKGLSEGEQKQLHTLLSKLLSSLEASKEGKAEQEEFGRLMHQAQHMREHFGGMPPFGYGHKFGGPHPHGGRGWKPMGPDDDDDGFNDDEF